MSGQRLPSDADRRSGLGGLAGMVFLPLAWLFVLLLVVQVFLAGLGVFESTARFEIHRSFGYGLGLVTLALLILALLAPGSGSRRG